MAIPALLGRTVLSGGGRAVSTNLSRGGGRGLLTASEVTMKMNNLKKRVKLAAQKSLKEHGEAEVRDVQQRITLRKTDPYGRRWAPWSFATRRQRLREGTVARGLLYRTGALRRSFRSRVTRNSVSVYSTSPIAQYLAQGRRNMRPRVLVDLGSKLSRNRFRKILTRNMKKAQR